MSRVKEQKEAIHRASRIIEDLEYIEYNNIRWGVVKPVGQLIHQCFMSELIDYGRKVAKFEEDEVWMSIINDKIVSLTKIKNNSPTSPAYTIYIMGPENIGFFGWFNTRGLPSTKKVEFSVLGDAEEVVINAVMALL